MTGTTPYDETADAKLDLQHALARAATANRPTIIVFGANWCPDCLVLDQAMKSGLGAPFLSDHFEIVKVNIGRRDKNVEVAKIYGVDVMKGIPSIAVVSSKNETIYVTMEGELSRARSMSEQEIYDFFKRATAPALAKE